MHTQFSEQATTHACGLMALRIWFEVPHYVLYTILNQASAALHFCSCACTQLAHMCGSVAVLQTCSVHTLWGAGKLLQTT